MSTPVFKNSKPYTVGVPTPTGSSVNVLPGFFVQGTFFSAFYATNRELTLMDDGFVAPLKQLVCSYDRASSVPVVSTAPPVALDRTPTPEPERVSEIIEEPKKNKGGRPKKNLEEAAKDLWKGVNYVLPATHEVAGMKTEDLDKLAIKLGVSKALPREELIENIKLKLG